MSKRFRKQQAHPAVQMVLAFGMVLLFPLVASGSVGRFLPNVYRFGSYLEVDMRHESNTSSTAGLRRAKIVDTYLRERLGVYTRGFIYHPRFMSFYLTAAGGLDQERYKSDGTDTSWVTGNNLEYDLRLKVLPRHPYSLELYTLRRDPFTRPVFSAGSRTTTYEKGAIFDYNQKPFFFNATYMRDTLSAKTYTMDSDTVRISGSHVAGIASNSINYSQTDSITSTNLTSDRKNMYFSNTLNLKNSYLTSGVSDLRFRQQDDASSFFQDKIFSWTELLAIKWPWNFKTHGWYELRKNWNSNGESVSGQEIETLTETENAKIQISHRLFNSVRTNYDLNYITTRTTSGFLRAVSQYASGFYTKKIPRGRLVAGGHGSVSVWDRNDALDIINEIHNAQLLGINYFTLRVAIPDESTIEIRVKHPDTGLLVPLVLNLHYTVTPSGNSFEITIINLPPSVIGNRLLNYVYEFHASYTLLSQDVELETVEIGFDLRLELFDNLLTPYVTYVDTDQTVISGTLLGGVHDSTSQNFGLLVRTLSLEFLGEYQSFASNLNPSRTLRSELSYFKQLSTTSFLKAKARYRESDRLQGSGQRQEYVEKVSDLELRYQKNLPRQRLRLYINTSYSQRRASTDSDSYFATAYLSWIMGKMRLDAGASLNYVINEIADGDQTNMKEYYYLTLRRDLF